MKVYAHALLLPPDYYSGVDKVTVLNNANIGKGNAIYLAMYMENKRNGKLASKNIDSETKTAMFDLGDNVIYAEKNHGFAEIPAICSKPSFEKQARYRVVNPQSTGQYKFVKVKDLLEIIEQNSHKLKSDSEEMKKANLTYKFLYDGLKYDQVIDDDYVYIPFFSVAPTDDTWEKYVLTAPGKTASATCFICDADVSLIHPKEVIHYSNRKVLDEKSFFTLRALLESTETESMALKLIDGCNISKSLIYIGLLLNHLRIGLIRQKKSPLPNVSLWFEITNTMTLDGIVETINSEQGGLNKLTNDDMEFIADNYYIQTQQQSSHFEFKLKPKKK